MTGERSLRPLTTRLDVNLGYVCNNNCLFCYFRHRKQERRNPSTEKIVALFSRIKKLGIDTLEMTGGEVTLRPDIMELISVAKKDLQYKKITIITNGSRFCDLDFAREAIQRGVDDVLVSVHGPAADLHDKLTDRKGSFLEAAQAIKNVLGLGASCRTNTVINDLNYRQASVIAGRLSEWGVKKINFIFFSPLDDAARLPDDLWPRYSDAAPFIKGMIDAHAEAFETISIKVIPFCFMEGYENYVTNFWQNLYDPYEWDFFNRVRIRRGAFTRTVAVAAGMVFFMDLRRMVQIGVRKSLYEAIARVQSYRECAKSPICRKCRYRKVCPGVWKDYAKRYGLGELRAIRGECVIDVDFSVRKRFADYE